MELQLDSALSELTADAAFTVTGNDTVATSTFTVNDSIEGFVASVEGLTWSDFRAGYGGYYYQDDAIVDAEKCSKITQDDMMCWAAATNNMLYYTGWSIAGYENEDELFDIFVDSFLYGEDFGGRIDFGLEWFLTGEHLPTVESWEGWDKAEIGTGGYYSFVFDSVEVEDYIYSVNFTVDGLTQAKEMLEEGGAAGISFGYYDSSLSYRYGGHAVTLWGMTYDTSLSVTDPNYFTGIIISDSDDNKGVSEPLDAPDTLKVISITYNAERGVYVLDPAYAGSDCVLEELFFLEKNPGFDTNIPSDSIKIYDGRKLVSSAAIMSEKKLMPGLTMFISSGGIALDTVIKPDGTMCISSGGIASNTTVSSGGHIFIDNGGSAADTVIKKGTVDVFSGGKALDTVIHKGELNVLSGGLAQGTTLSSNGSVIVNSGGQVLSTILSSGSLQVLDGGNAAGTTVSSGGSMFVSSGGTALSTILDGGEMILSSGALHKGELVIRNAASFIAVEGSTVEFTLAGRSAASDYLINDLALIKGAPTYTIVVDDSQDCGTYKLAQGAADFAGTISIGNGIAIYDSLSIGEGGESRQVWNDRMFQLTKQDDDLFLEVSENPFDMTITVNGNPTEWTNNNVCLTAVLDGADEFGSIQYSFDNQEWNAYDSEQGVVLTENGTAFFKAVNAEGDEVLTVVSVDKIDKAAPVLTVSEVSSEWTNNDVRLTAKAVDAAGNGAVIWYKKEGDEAFSEYTDSIAVSENGSYRFYAVDSFGNKSEEVTRVVANIDKTVPTLEISGNAENWTNEDVVLAASAADQGGNAVTIYYKKKGDAAFAEYTKEVTVTENATYIFYAQDIAGNKSAEQTVVVDKIDKAAPELIITGNAEDWTNEDVVLTAEASDQTLVTIYYKKEGDAEFAEYTEGVTVTENAAYIFYAQDALGHKSAEQTVVVDKIDKTVPTLEISGNAEEWTNGDVVLTASAADQGENAVTIYYKKEGDAEFTEYSEALTVFENGTYIFYAQDVAGNKSAEQAVVVDKIDKAAPELVVSEVSAEWTNGAVIITADAADAAENGAVIWYKKEGDEAFSEYTDSIAVSENGSYIFYAVDSLGNKSEEVTRVVANIDTIAPSQAVLDVAFEQGEFQMGVDFLEDEGSGIGKYILEVSTDETFAASDTHEYTDLESFNALSFADGTYYFRFRAEDLAGNVGEWSSVVTATRDTVAPEKPAAVLTPDVHTNKDVTVEAVFSEDSVTQEYSFDGETWYAYTEGIVFTENGVVYFRGIDAAGNISEIESCEVTNIDKAAPELNVSEVSTEWTNGAVIITTAAFDAEGNGAAVYYKRDGGEFSLCPEDLPVTDNGTYTFYAVDSLGNKSEEVTRVVANIDTVAPSTAELGVYSSNGELFFTFDSLEDEGSGIANYILEISESGEFEDAVSYTGPDPAAFKDIALEEKTYYFRIKAEDFAGNVGEWSNVAEFTYDNTAPEKPAASVSTEDPTNEDVTVEAVFSEDSVTQEYSFDGETWYAYTEGIVFTENGVVYFRGIDAAGNISEIESCEVTNIDKAAPELNVSEVSTEWTNGAVIITADAADAAENGAVIWYKKEGDETFSEYTDSIAVSENGSYIFYAVDSLGNKSEEVTRVVANIDTVAPSTAELGVYSSNGELFFTFDSLEDEGSGIANYILEISESGEFEDAVSYTGPDPAAFKDITLEEKTYYFRVKAEDFAGNVGEWSNVAEFTYDNTAPEKPAASVSTEDPTNEDVTVEAVFSEDSVTQEYSFDGETWYAYTEGIVFTENGVVYFRGIDAAGNISEIESCEVTNIDKAAPELTISGNTEDWTNKDVILTATAVDAAGNGAAIYYRKEGENSIASYNDAAVITENGTYIFTAIDRLGNIREVEVVVDNIDKAAPELTISGNTEDWTNEDVILTAEAADAAGNGAVIYYKKEGDAEFAEYSEALTVIENGTCVFYAEDALGNKSEVEVVTVGNIDKRVPTLEISGNAEEWTNKDVTLTAAVNDSDSGIKSIEYSFDNEEWFIGSEVTLAENGTVWFKVTDNAGNVTVSEAVEVTMIDKEAPTLEISADLTELTTQDVVLSAVASDGTIRYYDGSAWVSGDKLTVSENGIYLFCVTDLAGNITEKSILVENIDKEAPDQPDLDSVQVKFNNNAQFTWDVCQDNGVAGFCGYYFRYGTSAELEGDGVFVSNNKIAIADFGSPELFYQIRSVDKVGNLSEWTEVQSVVIKTIVPGNPVASPQGVSWQSVFGASDYTVVFTKDNFKSAFTFTVSGNAVDVAGAGKGNYCWKVATAGSDEFIQSNKVNAAGSSGNSKYVSDSDGDTDLFVAVSKERWGSQYAAEHNGVFGGWQGTHEQIALGGKNVITDIFQGSDDASVLILSDDAHGDALFVEDIYSASLGNLAQKQSRIAQIDRIFAGAGDDVVDMTSQQFAYIGSGVTVYGGLGNDTIWANNGDNILFGDAGNDRIVGGSGDDIIVGGSGNDTMHGGGGDDIFTFGGSWGKDVVEQLEGGNVTLWFEEGSESCWDADTLTYTDGSNTVTVKGVTEVTLKFGGDAPVAGAFDAAASEKIFEDKNKGFIA